MTMIPLKAGAVLFLKGDRFDLEKLRAVLGPLGLEAYLTTRAKLAEVEVRRILLEQGMGALWRTVVFEEAVLPRTPDVPALVAVLREMLQRLSPESDFIVVDRFLFPSKKRCPADYLNTLLEVLEPVVRGVRKLLVITSSDHNVELPRLRGQCSA